MKIGPRDIGPDTPPYIVAEAGVNHDGSVARAHALVDAAAAAGADAVKFQVFRADLLLSASACPAAYQVRAGERDVRAMLRRLELPPGAWAELVAHAHACGLHAIASVFSLPLVGEAVAAGFDALKVASPDVVNRPLLEAVAATGLPMIISTGAATRQEVVRCAAWLDAARDRTVFLQCVSSYPAADSDASIAAMVDIVQATGLPAGYSDHTLGVDTGALAAGAGAVLLEKHLTHSRAAAGPDHAASLEPAEFRAYVQLARDEGALRIRLGPAYRLRADPRLGLPLKRVLACEHEVRRWSRQSLVWARSLQAGEAVQAHDVTIKRPGTGLEPWQRDQVVGRIAARAVRADRLIEPADLVPTACSVR